MSKVTVVWVGLSKSDLARPATMSIDRRSLNLCSRSIVNWVNLVDRSSKRDSERTSTLLNTPYTRLPRASTSAATTSVCGLPPCEAVRLKEMVSRKSSWRVASKREYMPSSDSVVSSPSLNCTEPVTPRRSCSWVSRP